MHQEEGAHEAVNHDPKPRDRERSNPTAHGDAAKDARRPHAHPGKKETL
jgi:hypothetical protein